MKFTGTNFKKGSVAAFIVVIGAVLIILGTSMIAIGYQARIRAIRTANRISARMASDAGMVKAYYAMKKALNEGSLDDDALPSETDVAIPDSLAKFSYVISGSSSSGYTVSSTGTYGSQQIITETVYEMGGSIYEYAVFAIDNIDLKNSAEINWYNFDDEDDPLKIGTDSISSNAIELKNTSFINGDVVIGPGGEISIVLKQTGGTYSGEAYTQGSTFDPPSVAIPETFSSYPSSGKIKKDTTITASGKYTEIKLGKKETLTIDGNVEIYVTGDFTLGNGAELVITEGSSLDLYVDGDLEAKNGSELNNENQSPINFKILATENSDKIVFKNSSEVYGIIYAPDSDVKIHNSAHLFGAIIAESAELKNSAKVYYDTTLRDIEDDTNLELELKRWDEK